MKKTINPKYTLPLLGTGLFCTYQSAYAMFNPPKNPPKVQHFNKPITSSSNYSTTTARTGRLQTVPAPSHSPLTNTNNSGRPLTSTVISPNSKNPQLNTSTSSESQTTTHSPRPWRSQQTSSSNNPNRPTGGKISSLISKFELLSTSGTKTTSIPKTSDSSTRPSPTPDYTTLGARPKTSTSKTPNPSTTDSPKKGESTLKVTAHNLSDLIKDSAKTALEDELSRELNVILTQNKSSSGETIDQTVTNIWKVVSETSSEFFETELRNELSLRGINLNKKGKQDLVKASENFGRHMGNTAATHLKRSALGFRDVAVTEDNIPEVIEKIEKVSQSFGDNMASSVFREFLTSAFDFIVDHS